MKIHFKVGKVQWNSPKRTVRREIDFCGFIAWRISTGCCSYGCSAVLRFGYFDSSCELYLRLPLSGLCSPTVCPLDHITISCDSCFCTL